MDTAIAAGVPEELLPAKFAEPADIDLTIEPKVEDLKGFDVVLIAVGAGAPEQAGRLAEMRDLLRQQAVDLGDTQLLDGDGFTKKTVDRSQFSRTPVDGMGWRWY